MKITFILPAVGRKIKQRKYLKTWQMEPLAIAQLASLTPLDVEMEFFDDRVEEINYQTQTDLVAINIETYTAKRAYEIAKEFKSFGRKIIMGGFHATLFSEEVLDYADAVLIGEAENLWAKVISDCKNNNLQAVYKAEERPSLAGILPNRSIYKNKKYLKLGLIETGRGCYFKCDFCSIASFYNYTYKYRPVKDILNEIKDQSYKYYFFVDDNICANIERSKELFRALIPLKIKWVGQASIDIARDDELLSLMKASGCLAVLIGFESLNQETLREMGKPAGYQNIIYDEAVKKIHRSGLRIYATFVFGYNNQDEYSFQATYKFVKKHKFIIAAFNHLVPFPGTPLYKRLAIENRLLYKKWWLEPTYHFGDVAFRPNHINQGELAGLCHQYRKKFYSIPSLWRRLFNFKLNFNSLDSLFIFFAVNILSKIDARKRKGLPIGKEKNR